MPDVLVLPDLIGVRADVLSPAFVGSWTDGGRGAAWVHVAGELDLATVPQLERTLREAQLQARLVVLDLRELASTPVSAPARPAAGWFFSAVRGTSTGSSS